MKDEQASHKETARLYHLLRKKCFWEKTSNDLTNEELIAEVERRSNVDFDDLTVRQAGGIIDAIKGYLDPTHKPYKKRCYEPLTEPRKLICLLCGGEPHPLEDCPKNPICK